MLRPAYAPLVIGAIWHGVSGGSLVTSFALIHNKKHHNTSHVGLTDALHSDDIRQAGALDTWSWLCLRLICQLVLIGSSGVPAAEVWHGIRRFAFRAEVGMITWSYLKVLVPLGPGETVNQTRLVMVSW